MSIPELRRVQIFEGNWSSAKLKGEAWFHGFGVDFEECNGGVGAYTVAIIEGDNGQVGYVPSCNIRFLDRYNEMANGGAECLDD
ncbi:MAG: hypothetical protein GY832_22130 [Chloroflexi bacterium]|nr:hypothetical protein [Chloroflexota bacterium]